MINPYQNVKYKTYKNIEKASFIIFYLTLIANKNIDNQSMSIASNFLSMGALSNYLYMISCNHIGYTKELNNIYSIYQEYLNNYLKLSNELAGKNLIDISVLFYTMYRYGYLSINQKYEFNNRNCIENNRLLGSNIINGNGVCRHVASLLKDILNKSGFEAYPLTVNIRDYKLCYNQTKDNNLSEEEKLEWLINNIYSDKLFKEAYEKVTQNPEISFYLQEYKEKSFFKNILANHAITYINKDNTNYFIDPTYGEIYNLNKEKQILYNDEIYAYIKPVSSYLIGNNIKDIKHITNTINKNHHHTVLNTNPFQEKNYIYKKYKDILDDYYEENLETLKELNIAANSFKKRCLK